MEIPKMLRNCIYRAKNSMDAIVYELEDTEYATADQVDKLRKALWVLEDLCDD